MISLYRTIYRSSIYRTTIYYSNLEYRSVKYFCFTYILYLSCKNVHYPSCPKKHTIILYYYSIFWQGRSLHFRNHSYFWNPGYVFHPHVNHQISPPSNHKLYQIYTQFIPNIQIYFDTHFDKTQYFSNKTKLSDN